MSSAVSFLHFNTHFCKQQEARFHPRPERRGFQRGDSMITQSGQWFNTYKLLEFSPISASSLGDNTIVASVAGHKIRVVSLVLVSSAAMSVQWKTSSGTALSGAMPLAINGGYALDSEFGLLETKVGDGLVLNLSSANDVAGHLMYVVLPG